MLLRNEKGVSALPVEHKESPDFIVIRDSIKLSIESYNKTAERKHEINDESITEAAKILEIARKKARSQKFKASIQLINQALKLCEPIPLIPALSIRAFINTYAEEVTAVNEEIISDATMIIQLEIANSYAYFYRGIANYRMGKYKECYEDITTGMGAESACFDFVNKKFPSPTPLQETALATLIECEHKIELAKYNPLDDLPEKTVNRKNIIRATEKALKKALKARQAKQKDATDLEAEWRRKALIILSLPLKDNEATLTDIDYRLFGDLGFLSGEAHKNVAAIRYYTIAFWVAQHQFFTKSKQLSQTKVETSEYYRLQKETSLIQQELNEYFKCKEKYVKVASEIESIIQDETSVTSSSLATVKPTPAITPAYTLLPEENKEQKACGFTLVDINLGETLQKLLYIEFNQHKKYITEEKNGKPDETTEALLAKLIQILEKNPFMLTEQLEAVINLFYYFAQLYFYSDSSNAQKSIALCCTPGLIQSTKLGKIEKDKGFDYNIKLLTILGRAHESLGQIQDAINAFQRELINAKLLVSQNETLKTHITDLEARILTLRRQLVSDKPEPVKVPVVEYKEPPEIKRIRESIKENIQSYKTQLEGSKPEIDDDKIDEAAKLIFQAKTALSEGGTRSIELCDQALVLCKPYPLYEALEIKSCVNILHYKSAINQELADDATLMIKMNPESALGYFFYATAMCGRESHLVSYKNVLLGIKHELNAFDQHKSINISKVHQRALTALVEFDRQCLLGGYDPLKKELKHKNLQNRQTYIQATETLREKALTAFRTGVSKNDGKLIEEAIQHFRKALVINIYQPKTGRIKVLDIDYSLYFQRAQAFAHLHNYVAALADADIAMWMCQHQLTSKMSQKSLKDNDEKLQIEIDKLAQDIKKLKEWKEIQSQASQSYEATQKVAQEELKKFKEEQRLKKKEALEQLKLAAEEKIKSDAAKEAAAILERERKQAQQILKAAQAKAAKQEAKQKAKNEKRKQKVKEKARKKFKQAIYTVLTASALNKTFAQKAMSYRTTEAKRLVEEEKKREESQRKALEQKYIYLEKRRKEEEVKMRQQLHKMLKPKIKQLYSQKHLQSEEVKARSRELKKLEQLNSINKAKEGLKQYEEQKKQLEQFRQTVHTQYKGIESTLLQEQSKLQKMLALDIPSSPIGPLPSPLPISVSAICLEKKSPPISDLSDGSLDTLAPTELKCAPPDVSPLSHVCVVSTSADSEPTPFKIPSDQVSPRIITQIQNELARFEDEAGAKLTFAVGGIVRDPLMGRTSVKFKKDGSSVIDIDIVTEGGRKEVETVYTKEKGFSIVETTMPDNSGTLFTVYQASESAVKIHRQIFSSPYFAKDQTPQGYKYKYPDPLFADALSRDQPKNAVYFDRNGYVYMPLGAQSVNAISNKQISLIDQTRLKELKGEAFDKNVPPDLRSIDEDPKRLLRVLIDFATNPEDKLMVEHISEGISLLLKNSKGVSRSEAELSSINVCLSERIFSSPKVISIFKSLNKFGVINTLFPELIESIIKNKLWDKLKQLFKDPMLRLEEIYAGMIVLQHHKYLSSLSREQIANDDFLLNEMVKLIQNCPLYKVCFNSYHQRTINYIQRRRDETIQLESKRPLKAPPSLCALFRKSIQSLIHANPSMHMYPLSAGGKKVLVNPSTLVQPKQTLQSFHPIPAHAVYAPPFSPSESHSFGYGSSDKASYPSRAGHYKSGGRGRAKAQYSHTRQYPHPGPFRTET